MLESLGLTAEQQRVYLVLLEHGDGHTADRLGLAAGANVERILDGLEERGLVERSPTVPATFRLVDPGVAFAETLAGLDRRVRRSRRLVEDLAHRHRRENGEIKSEDVVEVVASGRPGTQRLFDLYGRAEREVCSMERPPYGSVPLPPNPFEAELLAKGVRHRVLYEQRAVDLPGRLTDILSGIAAGEEARVAPDLPARVLLIDDAYALLPSRTGGLITEQLLVVHVGGLFDALRELFEATWERAMPLRLDPDANGEVDDDQIVLNLLAAGLTEQAIARQIGASERTVQRRIREVSERLGARTRFQAGLQAARHGVL